MSASASTHEFPRYALYGETDGDAALEPLHIETLVTRSRPNRWRIEPHRHDDLVQVMWMTRGGGSMQIEERQVPLRPGDLAAIPAGSLHAFEFDETSDGYVLMLTNGFLAAQALALERVVTGAPSEPERLNVALAALLEAFQGRCFGRSAALTGWALVIVSELERLKKTSSGAPPSPAAQLVQAFRGVVEACYRDHPGVEAIAAGIGTTRSGLARACSEIAGRTPLQLVHDRQILEARRLLVYTTQPVAQIGYQLGFSDPAYFSRFFQRCVGVSPLDWRRRQRAG